MSGNIESKIMYAIKSRLENSPIEDEKMERLASLFDFHSESNNPNANVVSGVFESEISGPNLPPWINPFAFDDNLGAAYATLEELDLLIDDHDAIVQRHLDYMYYFLALPTEQKPDIQGIYEDSDYPTRIESLELRITKKLEELLHLTKAAKLGARLLFGFSMEILEFNEGRDSIEKVRESLRILGDRYKSAATKYFNTVIKVSLKHARTSESVPALISNSFANTVWNTHINNLTPIFDLSKVRELSDYKRVYLHDVGIQVIDKESSHNPVNDNTMPVDAWHVSLESSVNDVQLGDEDDSPSYNLPQLYFSSVPGDYDGTEVRMAKNYRIKGIDPRREWQLRLEKFSVFNKDAMSADGVLDVIIHLNVIARK
jgi:hypothetical protein